MLIHLTLKSDSFAAEIDDVRNVENAFIPFDGSYPKNWPVFYRLPEGVWIAECGFSTAQLTSSGGTEIDFGEIAGILPGTPQGVIHNIVALNNIVLSPRPEFASRRSLIEWADSGSVINTRQYNFMLMARIIHSLPGKVIFNIVMTGKQEEVRFKHF